MGAKNNKRMPCPNPAPEPKPSGRREKEPVQQAIPLIVAAMRAIDPEGEWYSLGQIGQFITQANPDFDTRTYGKRKLSDLIAELKRFQTKREGNRLFVRRAD